MSLSRSVVHNQESMHLIMFLDQRQGVCKLEEKNTSFEWNIQGLLKIKQFEIEEKEPKTSETDTKEIGDTVTYTIY